jgi:hypothetical protein
MKLTFFLIAFFLMLLGVYFSKAGFGHKGHGTMVVKSDNYIEEVSWDGKTRLSDDEKSIIEITPGGYLKFRENDTTLKAESNLQGEITYTLYNGRENLSLNDSGRRFVAVVLQKMIAMGFYSEGRAERIYKKGGARALLEELPRLRMDNAKGPYVDLLFKSDSLTKDEMSSLIKLMDESGNDMERQNFLARFTRDRLKDSALAKIWLGSVDHLPADFEKQNLLTRFIGQGPVEAEIYDSLLATIGHLGADFEKQDLLTKLMKDSLSTDDQWIGLIRAVSGLDADFEKSPLLVQIAQKMPQDEKVKAAYLAAAKTIKDDMEYGKVMRVVE